MNLLNYPFIIRVVLSVFLSISSLFCQLFDLAVIPYGIPTDMDRFELVWSDEFDGNEIDETKWDTTPVWNADKTGTSVRKGGYWNPKMCSVSDGALHISTKYYPDGFEGNGKPGWYSTQITTDDKFEKCGGYFECRCILPKGAGLWSAFWIYSGDVGSIGSGGVDGAEIDIFESPYYCKKGKQKNSVSSCIHYDGYGEYHKQRTACRTRIVGNNPYEEFNTYAVEWNEKEYIFYINGIKVGTSDFGGTSQVEEYMILSTEVGGENGIPAESWAGPSIEENKEAPTDFIVDYVRVYEYK